jgi:hypothetical protein
VANFVIDTNVWVMPDREIHTLDTLPLVACAETCREWLMALRTGENQAVVDDTYTIVGEYRRNLRQGGFGEKILNELMKTGRLIYRSASQLPGELGPEHFDPSDQKFVAVALASDPPDPIVNAVDSDWSEHRAALKQAGLTIIELCPDCIAQE